MYFRKKPFEHKRCSYIVVKQIQNCNFSEPNMKNIGEIHTRRLIHRLKIINILSILL